MAAQSGLPPKVIKHWFRNTLFKERQRNKDSPYNFNNPPSTTLNLEEYEKTGEAKVTPLNSSVSGSSSSDDKSPNKQATPPPTATSVNTSQPTDIKQEIQEQPQCHIQQQSQHQEEQQHHSPGSSGGQQSRPHSPALSMSSVFSGIHHDVSTHAPSATSTPSAPMLPPKLAPQNFASPNSGTSSVVASPIAAMALTPQRSLSPGRGPTDYSFSGSANGSSSSGGSSGKRANRTRFTDYQIKVLQEFFENNAYPKDDDLEYLSKLLGLSPRVIVVWFQNARQKARKVYENQPAAEPVTPGGREGDDGSGRFQRTPGLNYQCKKCLLVFQRYYELIRHQKTHCFKEEDAKRSAQAQAAAAQVAAVLSSEDSNSSSTTTTANAVSTNPTSAPALAEQLQQPLNTATPPHHQQQAMGQSHQQSQQQQQQQQQQQPSQEQQVQERTTMQPLQLQVVSKPQQMQIQQHLSSQSKKPAFVVVSTSSQSPVPVYKITIREGKQILTKVETDASNINSVLNSNSTNVDVNGDIVENTLPVKQTPEEVASTELSDGVVSGQDCEKNIAQSEKLDQVSSEVKQTIVDSTDNLDVELIKNKESKDIKDLKDNTNSESSKSSSNKENRDSSKKDDKKSSSSDKKSHHSSSSSSKSSSKHTSSSSSHRSSSTSYKSSSHRSSSSSSSKSSNSKDKSSKDKEKHHSSNSSNKHNSSKNKSDKEREKEKQKKDQAEKDKATLEKIQGQALSSKFGKIPKKKSEEEKLSDVTVRKSSTDSRDSSKENKTDSKKVVAVPEKKNISISIESRKNSQDSTMRPKTVKTFNSKFRSTGLEEEVKPPPPRSAKKLHPIIDKKVIPQKLPTLKRPSPLRESISSTDKRAKLSLESPTTPPSEEKKGGIKLIPPKPKRKYYIVSQILYLKFF
uniref:Zinc finger protein n=1 Tax=Apis cerana TaxID=7461 RepID=V9IAW7_APICE